MDWPYATLGKSISVSSRVKTIYSEDVMRIRLTHTQIAMGVAVGLMVVGIPLSAPQAQPLSPLDQGKGIYMGNCAGCHGFDEIGRAHV